MTGYGRPVDWVLALYFLDLHHFCYGAEVVLDVDSNLLKSLCSVQNEYARRLLGLQARSAVVVLHSELGNEPIPYRRALMALRYMHYLSGRPHDSLAAAAYRETFALTAGGSPSWVSDLFHVLNSLRIQTPRLTASPFTPDQAVVLVSAAEVAMRDSVQALIDTSSKLRLLRGRKERDGDGRLATTPLAFRHYLRVPIHDHRVALTKLILSDHILCEERGRWIEGERQRIPREWRLCRLCRRAVESPEHALLECQADEPAALRLIFISKITADVPPLAGYRGCTTLLHFCCRKYSRGASS